MRIGLLPFGLDRLLSASADQLSECYKAGVEIIRGHFEEQDAYDVERLRHFPQYWREFQYGGDEAKMTSGDPKQNKEDSRWKQLPWHLRSNLDLKTKRLITQLR